MYRNRYFQQVKVVAARTRRARAHTHTYTHTHTTTLSLSLHLHLQAVAAICSFPSIEAAVDTSVQVLQAGIPVAKIEFMDDLAIYAANNHYAHMNLPVAPTLLFEFGGSPQSVEEQANIVGESAIVLLCVT